MTLTACPMRAVKLRGGMNNISSSEDVLAAFLSKTLWDAERFGGIVAGAASRGECDSDWNDFHMPAW
jgi:hypothetical protein